MFFVLFTLQVELSRDVSEGNANLSKQGTPAKSKDGSAMPKTTPAKSKAASKAITPSTAEASPEQPNEGLQELVGKRIRVYWRDDNNWYFGKVIDFSDGKHLIHYEDGDKEKLVLKNEKVS